MKRNVLDSNLFFFCCFLIFPLLIPLATNAGSYLDSAHGNPTNGVNRVDISLQGYSTGNCNHCHEQHGQIDGNEPVPEGGGPSVFGLFAANFNSLATPPYDESDNICFSCHNDFGSVMQVTNYNFAQTFGGYTGGGFSITSILDAFTPPPGTPHSQHNLSDVWNFSRATFPYFKDTSNPCTACHNPHSAKRNKANPTDPTFTAISKPSDHNALWGDDLSERMSNYTYQPPYMYNSTGTYEPGGTANHDGSKMPDYSSFCTDCHNETNTIWSTALGRDLYKFNWAVEKHGGGAAISGGMGGGGGGMGAALNAPYSQTLVGQYSLSCTDCHEPHGSSNVFLIRTAVNKRATTIPAGRGKWHELCASCHSSIPQAHHQLFQGCTMQCHYMEWNPEISAYDTVYRECVVCHYHGSTKVFNGTTQTYETYNGGEHVF